MKRVLLGLSVILLTVSTITLIRWKSFYDNKTLEQHVSAAALYGSSTPIEIPTETGEKGTNSNPFVILEIVPYEGYAEIGYMIQGCEPIPMDKLIFDRDAGGLLQSIGGMTYEWKQETTFDIPSTDRIGSEPGDWQIYGEADQYGYFKKVAPGEGNFNITIVASTVTKVKEEKGDYIWVAAERNEAGSLPVDYKPDEIYYPYVRRRVKYYRYRNYFTHQHHFAKVVLGLREEQIPDYKITVITITPEKLNLSINFPLIDRADLIFISPKCHVGDGVVALWEKYNPSLKVAAKTSKQTNGFIDNDITWETAAKLLRKTAIDEDSAPIIFDVNVLRGGGVSIGEIKPVKYYSNGTLVNDCSASGYLNNVAKLYLIMQQMEPAKFYREYIETELIQSVPIQIKKADDSLAYLYNGSVRMTTGYYISQDSSYNKNTVYKKYKTNWWSSTDWDPNPAAIWSWHTFLPYELFHDWHALDNHKVWKNLGIDYILFIDSDKAHLSVRHNLFSYNGDTALNQQFVNNTHINYNQYRAEAFEFYNMSSGTISPAMAIYYLLHKERPMYSKEVLRILEIEPCNDFIWTGNTDPWEVGSGSNGTAYGRQFFMKFFPNYKGRISIKTMTSSEFIGNISDLNANYDMIFFGLRDGLLKKDYSGYPIYNDAMMYKKVYTHNGDLILQANQKLRGLPITGIPEDTYRFSGNDITLLKLNELKNFMQGGKAIVLDTGFYNDSTGTNVNTAKIDVNSNIYKLASLDRSTYPQLFYADNLLTSSLEKVVGKISCKIVFGNTQGTLKEEECYPVVYRDRTLDEFKSYSDGQIYINGNNPSYRTLQYKFYIKDDPSNHGTYTVKLYIDINADGKYDDATENVTDLVIQDENGYAMDYTSLEPMVNYTLTRTLESDYFGILPWKLEIISNKSSEGETRDSVINYAALKTAKDKKIQLNVLQIMSNPEGGIETNNVRLNNSLFSSLISKVADYKINITCKYVYEVDEWCGIDPNAYTYILSDDDDDIGDTDGIDGIDDDGDHIYDFDMLVIGFADCYSDIGNPNTLRNINEFIEEGKTVLFTHDTTSFVNLPKEVYQRNYQDFWGYSLSKYFRNIFGMDRFGVTLSYEERVAAGKDYASTPTDYSGYIHGYSNMILNRYAKNNGQYGSHINVNFSSMEDDLKSKKVTQTNQGQITEYPFKIKETFDIAETHAQYYQLDLENDDIVVWYCLSDSKDSTNNGFYSTTPNDVRNNYYIYNIGNITYSGVGHSAVTGEMEAKLFVNTMIAAYSATAKSVEVVITNKHISKGIDADYIYVDYDIYNTTLAYGNDVKAGAGDQYQKVKFRIIDNNILFNKVITLSYYAVTKDAVSGKEIETRITDTVLRTRRVRDDALTSLSPYGHIVDSGTEYYIDVPLSVLQRYQMTMNNNFGTRIRIKVLVTYGRDSGKAKITNHDFILARRGLFDLD